MARIYTFNGGTRLDTDPDRVLQELHGQLDAFILAGITKDGDDIFVVTFASLPEALWMHEKLRDNIKERGEPDETG